MQTVKNISSIQYFLNRFPTLDHGFDYSVNYHPDAESQFTSLPTFVAEFFNCKVNTCPLLITDEGHMITQHVWNLTHKSKHKPDKTHDMWKTWKDNIELDLPPVTKHFNETYTYVWLPFDTEAAGNPWHIWIDVISKFRLINKCPHGELWASDFSKYVFILPTQSKYFDRIAKEFFPKLKYMVMPKGETWQFKHILVPSTSNHSDGVITPGLAPWIREQKNSLKVNSERKRKIFISRDDAKTRKLLNAEQLMLALQGWETVTLENLSIKEQVKCFTEASHIIAPHGAGLANLLWCGSGTKVIEIQDPKMIRKKVYPVLSHHLGLEHQLYLAKTVPIKFTGSKHDMGVKRLNDLINFEVNIPDLISCLEN